MTLHNPNASALVKLVVALAILLAMASFAFSEEYVIIVQTKVNNSSPVVGKIMICDSDCSLSKTIDPGISFTIDVNITDPNGYNDLNTESISVELYAANDLNGCIPNWDCNVLNILDSNIWLGTANGCTHAPAVGTYCITLGSNVWTTKFLNGDANIYISIDDNSGAFDSNALTAGNLIINPNINISEDTTSGTYSGAPNTSDINFTSTQTGFSYVDTNHNGNCNIDITIRATDLNISSTVFIGDDNQSWHLTNFAGSSTAFTGTADTVLADWNRGNLVTSDSNSQVVYTWLDVPNQQQVGDYEGTLTYGSSAS